MITKSRFHTSNVSSKWTCTNTCRNLPSFQQTGVLLNFSAVSSFLSSPRCVWKLWLHITKSLIVLSAWQVNVNLNQWLLPLLPPPTPSLRTPPFCSLCNLPIRKRACVRASCPAPLPTYQLNNKNLRWWRTKEGLQRTEGGEDEGDQWFTKVLSLRLVCLGFITADFKTPP